MHDLSLLLAKSNELKKYITYHDHMDLASKYGFYDIVKYILEDDSNSINYYLKLYDIAFDSGDVEWTNNIITMREVIF